MLNKSLKLYYHIKPLIPKWIRLFLRRKLIQGKLQSSTNVWPINEKTNSPPTGWSGWPEGKQFSLVLTHDVESAKGQEKCYELARLEEQLGFRSSFNFVAEEYIVKSELRHYLTNHGFEVGVHGLRHDGKLYESKETFNKQAKRINKYLKKWNCVGFRSPSMHYHMQWVLELDIEYDASTFDTDPFEPQPNGAGTIFPFLVGEISTQKAYVEMPYTLPQDYTLFILMKEKNIDIWKKKLDWIAENGGMALLITHPDYMNFNGKKFSLDEYPSTYYEEFLNFLKSSYEGLYWHAVPSYIASWFKKQQLRAKGEVKILRNDG